MLAIVAVDPAPASVNDTPAPAVRTLSLVRVASVARVTYSALVGAPPPPPPPDKKPSQSPRTAIRASCTRTNLRISSSFSGSIKRDSATPWN